MQLVLSDEEGNVAIMEYSESTTMATLEETAISNFGHLIPETICILRNGDELDYKDRKNDPITIFGIEDADMLLVRNKVIASNNQQPNGSMIGTTTTTTNTNDNSNDNRNVLTPQALADALAMTTAQMQQPQPQPQNTNQNMNVEPPRGPSVQLTGNSSSSSTSGRLTLDDLPPGLSPAGILEFFQVNDYLIKELNFNNPSLATAIQTGKVEEVTRVIQEQSLQRFLGNYSKEQEIRKLEEDPDNPENQAKMMEMIRLEQVQKNMESAMEYMPEAFGRVVMLYINVEVDGTPIKVLVDSGAQSTIMSTRCAERCGLMRLVDRRFGGVARGVGTANIVGRIHMAPIKIGNSVYPCTFTVMEKDIEFLFGLDMLKRYQCMIDLKRNVLCMGDAGVNDVRFLDENEIPPSDLEMRDDSNINEGNDGGNGNSLPQGGLSQGSEGQDEDLQRVLAESLQDNPR